jgi:hypothetical protein
MHFYYKLRHILKFQSFGHFFVSAGLISAVLCAQQVVSFVDIATEVGIDARNTFGGVERKDYILETTGNGVAVIDLDGNGNDEVLLLNGTRLEGSEAVPALYRNGGQGKLELVQDSGLQVVGWAQGVCGGDYDNDGKTDLLITYYGHNRLYRNLGGLKFENVSAKAGLPVSGVRYGSGCTFLDYDRDGRLDLFVANYVNLDLEKTPKPGKGEFCVWKEIPVMCGPRGLPLAMNVLYHQDANGRFRDVSAAAGILKSGGRYSLQAVSADFDNDGWPDMYVACDMTPSLLFRNRGNGTFEERGEEAGVAFNADGRLQAGMGVAVGDYNNDGFLDIAKTNFSGDLISLFQNEDGKFFNDVSGQARLGVKQLLGWGVAFVDWDADGWKDLMTVNGHVYPEVERAKVGDQYRQLTLAFRNLRNGRFGELGAGGGLATPRSSRGLGIGDLDGDGRPEAVILNMNDKPSVLKNTAGGGKFLNLRLTGVKANRSAIGARVTVEAAGGRQMDEVFSGSSFYSQNSLTMHFGLGSSEKADRVTVRWPGGKTEEWRGLAADQVCALTEGQAAAVCERY